MRPIPGFCPEDFIPNRVDGVGLGTYCLKAIHQKIGLHKNLIIYTVDIFISMMVRDEITNPVGEACRDAALFPQQRPCGGRPFGLRFADSFRRWNHIFSRCF